MKITPSKNYKKPLYAIGIAAAITAVSLTGCTDPGKVNYAGDIDVKPVESSVAYAGEIADTEPTESEVEIDGGVAVCTETKVNPNPLITSGIVPQTIDPDA